MAVDLSVGIIFKNEIRCLERCLKSLQPLRKRISLEIVLADTGSSDGSRSIAERYADMVFDFPWINDFAAARNAVLTRCRGKWYMQIDCDEWLDADCDELIAFLHAPASRRYDGAFVVMRNYINDAHTRWGDSSLLRLMRKGASPRYMGSIHEYPVFGDHTKRPKCLVLSATLVHHDGYVMLNNGSAEGRAKRARNVSLIKKELEDKPEDMRLLKMLTDSLDDEEERRVNYIRAVELIRSAGRPAEPGFEPVLLSKAVQYAARDRLPELTEWADLAEQLFPESYFTRVDIPFVLMEYYAGLGEHEKAVCSGREYLKAQREGSEDLERVVQCAFGEVDHIGVFSVRRARLRMAQEYAALDRVEEADAMLHDLPWGELNGEELENALVALVRLHTDSNLVTAPHIRAFWVGISSSVKDREAKRKTFVKVGTALFDQVSNEKKKRAAYTIFIPLVGDCKLGAAAELMDCQDAECAYALLAEFDSPEDLPVSALANALSLGCAFPVSGRTLRMEDADRLAAGLAEETHRELLEKLVLSAGESLAEELPSLLWQDCTALAALRMHDWKIKKNSLPLAYAFSRIEAAYLPRYYSKEALDEPELLPPMHRFGLCLTQALAALDSGNAVACVRLLREGLSMCSDAKPIVSFLLEEASEHKETERKTDAPSELLELAAQVRGILAAYPADSPAIIKLKNSPAYQKVAYLLEEGRDSE